MTVFNLDTHTAIAHLPLAAGPEVVKFDAGLGRIYVAGSSGAISIFQMDDPDHYRKIEDFPVQKAGTPSLWSRRRTACTHRSSRPTESRWRE